MESVLQVKNLKGGYGKKLVLHDVSFSVMPHETRIILGTSGCGKSTLLNNILGIERPFGGEISFWDTTLRAGIDLIPNSLRTKMGVLFQGGALLSSLTIQENVALPLKMHRPGLTPDIIQDIAADALDKVHLLHAYYKLPSELSGGMRKRAALARAIVLDPQLLFCDEPSAGLDPVTSRSLDDLLIELRENLGASIVVVTHELASIDAIADRILFLQKGTVLFDGTLADGKASQIPAIKNFFDRRYDSVSNENSCYHFNFEEVV
ncbi:MAG: ATP-binding cassette domain-containing protein [Fibrobacteraceae bacterium]|nr:ATP-binding cassette domain-containing protein [Fibrobacteraceae bacterium]